MNTPAVGPIVYTISDGSAIDTNFEQKKNELAVRARRAAGLGITHFQIREKALPADRQLEMARAVVEAARGTGLKVLVNGRFDIALAAGADGVHLPADGVPADLVRRHVPEGFLVFVSTHSAEEAAAAKYGQADMIVFGPVFESPGKGSGAGLEALREARRAADPVPVLALGGVDERNFRSALSAGAAGIAAIRFLNALIDRDERFPA